MVRNPSLRLRLLVATAVGLLLALAVAGWMLSGLFAQHVQKQFEHQLLQQLDQVTARLVFNGQQPQIDPRNLSDPRWHKPYSGLYWQLDALAGPGHQGRSAALRSRSLWDTTLTLDNDPMGDGQWHVHSATGPQQQNLLVVERALRSEDTPGVQWRLMVGQDTADHTAATQAYTRVLGWSLLVLFVLLMLAAWAQVVVGLHPLTSLAGGLQQLRQGKTQRLEGGFPAEVQPLVADLNQVLAHNEALLDRARTQAGNLAHALRTPLAVIRQVATTPDPHTTHWATVLEQVTAAQHHIDWHLKRARLAASGGMPGQKTAVEPLVTGLVRVMEKVHADKGLHITTTGPSHPVWFGGDAQDLQEMVGNLLDNACKWAHGTVRVTLSTSGNRVVIAVDDDGPGVAPPQLQHITQRGVRLDETTPGTGLGLAIAQDLTQLYGGTLSFTSPGVLGGLAATLVLPGTPHNP
ncbi:MAG: hypothetical protein RJA09_1439 [Pseudomonadota bacterium]